MTRRRRFFLVEKFLKRFPPSGTGINRVCFLPEGSEKQFPRQKRLPMPICGGRKGKLLECSDDGAGRLLQSGDGGESEFSGSGSREESCRCGRILHFEIDLEKKSDGGGAALAAWKGSEAIRGRRADFISKIILEHERPRFRRHEAPIRRRRQRHNQFKNEIKKNRKLEREKQRILNL